MIRELSLEIPRVFICFLNWWQVTSAASFFKQPGDHAGELETSDMMHLKPDLCLPLETAGKGKVKTFKIRRLKEGWAIAQREWTQVTEDTGAGIPEAASA